jgi:purine-nucleoside phosphorylase
VIKIKADNTKVQALKNAVQILKTRTGIIPKAALVLGSGLGALAETIKADAIIKYSEIEGMPKSTVSGHKGCFVFGHIGHVPVVIMQGRIHYYEGYSMDEVVMPIRIMGLMGAETLFLSNAAGGINKEFSTGDLMLITGQISSFVPSPLIGGNLDELGARFPDMSQIYNIKLQNHIIEAAGRTGLSIKKGVYLQVSGPNYESPEEIDMYRILGADAVGMSTACEAVAAHHMGLKVCGVSLITNMAAGVSETPLSHNEVKDMAAQKGEEFKRLITESVKIIGEDND